MKNVPLMLMLGTVLILSSAIVGVQTSTEQPCIQLDGVTASPSTDYDCKLLASAVTKEEDTGLSLPRWIASSRSFQFHYLDVIEFLFSAKPTDSQI